MTKRPRLRWLLIGLAVSALVIGGQFAFRPEISDLIEDKRSSFAPYASTSIHGVSLEDYLLRRTALLIGGATIKAAKRDGDRISLTFAEDRPSFSTASAAAVHHDGFFLTAAHCLEDSPVTLIVRNGENVRFSEARVVWQSETSDIALLQANLKPFAVFDFIEAPLKDGSPIVLTGATRGPAAGVVKGEFNMVGDFDTAGSVKLLHHNALVVSGDSGGPVATPKGRLIGIIGRGNYVYVCGMMIKNGVAYHLSKPHLDRLIDGTAASK